MRIASANNLYFSTTCRSIRMDKQPFSQTVIGSVVLGLTVAVAGGIVVHRITDRRPGTLVTPLTTPPEARVSQLPLGSPRSPLASSKPVPAAHGRGLVVAHIAVSQSVDGGETNANEKHSDLRTADGPPVSAGVPEDLVVRTEPEQKPAVSEGVAMKQPSRKADANSLGTKASSADAPKKSSAPSEEPAARVLSYDCDEPMSRLDFVQVANSIRTKSFESTKLTIAKQIIRTHCMRSEQVKDVMTLFSFESSKLDFAKFAWHYVFDPDEYFVVTDAFTFSSSIDDLNRYIEQQD